ncbi:hypothetical protein H6G04_18710 [Calothrix membranacea FACHB-236]|nr:hypothetical protein [Calothrix membranacea FACHB-236]
MNRLIWKTLRSCITLTALTATSIPVNAQTSSEINILTVCSKELLTTSSTADEIIKANEEMAISGALMAARVQAQVSRLENSAGKNTSSESAVEKARDALQKFNLYNIKKGFQELENKHHSTAMCFFNKIIVLNAPSKYAGAYLGRGLTYVEQGDKQSGLADLREAAELFKSQNEQELFQKVTRIIKKLTNNTSTTVCISSVHLCSNYRSNQ